MSRLDDFETEHKAVLRNPGTTITATTRRYMNDWMGDVKEVTGTSMTNLLNHAIGFAGLRRLALSHELQVVMRDTSGGIHELPLPAEAFTEREDDTGVRFNVTQQTESWLHWMQGREISVETAIFDGMQILGGLVLVPGAKLVIPDFGVKQSSFYWPAISLAGAPPLVQPKG